MCWLHNNKLAFMGPIVSLGSCAEGKEGLLEEGLQGPPPTHTHVTQPRVEGLRVSRRKGGQRQAKHTGSEVTVFEQFVLSGSSADPDTLEPQLHSVVTMCCEPRKGAKPSVSLHPQSVDGSNIDSSHSTGMQ